MNWLTHTLPTDDKNKNEFVFLRTDKLIQDYDDLLIFVFVAYISLFMRIRPEIKLNWLGFAHAWTNSWIVQSISLPLITCVLNVLQMTLPAGIKVVSFSSPLYYANVDIFRNEIDSKTENFKKINEAPDNSDDQEVFSRSHFGVFRRNKLTYNI